VDVWAQIKAWCVPVVCVFFVCDIFSAVIGHIGYDFPNVYGGYVPHIAHRLTDSYMGAAMHDTRTTCCIEQIFVVTRCMFGCTMRNPEDRIVAIVCRHAMFLHGCTA
jgi:hypothetical protein